MDKVNDNSKDVEPKSNSSNEARVNKSKQKVRPVKRRRMESESSSDGEDELPENMLETEKNLHASAVKNNLDEISVRKILKKVVTNDHVLALVKLREEEENELQQDDGKGPTKLTRSKVKELLKDSQKKSQWRGPMKPLEHIPVKTRPEVTALIAQDLPEEEDDDEYEPTHDDVPSDDDQTMESCSDLDSQPRTPATPAQQHTSPRVVKDGPFKVPQDVSVAKRKLDLEEEDATIARRTRSKLSLSSTSIEHIESTFVPPDDIPMPAVDDLWNQFLNECLNPASTSKHEDDDEADPEYNVAADPDALNEDDDNMSRNIIKISKKELSDLVTELCNIMPEATCDDLAENLANSVLTDTNNSTDISRWEGKQEMLSDEEQENRDRLQQEKRNTFTRFSVGKSEPQKYNEFEEFNEPEVRNDTGVCNDPSVCNDTSVCNDPSVCNEPEVRNGPSVCNEPEDSNELLIVDNAKERENVNGKMECEDVIVVEIKEEEEATPQAGSNSHEGPLLIVKEKAAKPEDMAPPVLRQFINEKQPEGEVQVVQIHVNPGLTMLPEQVLIFQQQLRQHIQLATSNFLQVYAHSVHWSFARYFKEYVGGFLNMTKSNPNTLANVCNLKPAYELISTWETTMSADTPENVAMITFVDKQSERCRRRMLHTSMPVLEFPEPLKQVVANSPVFLYPHMLPPTAFRPEHTKRFGYIPSEDALIALGLQEFWQYVEENAAEFRVQARGLRRGGMRQAAEQLVKYLMPWSSARVIILRLQNVRQNGRDDNPISKFFKYNKVDPVEHRLLPFNPHMTLHQHPPTEIPRIWLKHLAKTNTRYMKYLRRGDTVQAPSGVPVQLGQTVQVPTKNPLSIDYMPPTPQNPTDLPKPDLEQPDKNVVLAANLYSVMQTDAGVVLVPLSMMPNTNIVNSQTAPIMTPVEVQSNVPKTDNSKKASKKEIEIDEGDHCECCKLLRRILRKQREITDYFRPRTRLKKQCYCTDIKFPRVSNRLRLFLGFYSPQHKATLAELQERINETNEQSTRPDADDLEYALQFQCRLLTRISIKLSNLPLKKRLYSLFSTFDLLSGDPMVLAQGIYQDAKGDLVHIYNEFLGFLTAQQAENCDVFTYYFQSHVKTIIKRIEEQISDVELRKAVLNKLKTAYVNVKKLSSCEICKLLLDDLHGHPELAKFIFSFFPHKTCQPRSITWHAVKTRAVPTQPATPVAIAPAGEPGEIDPTEEPVELGPTEEPTEKPTEKIVKKRIRTKKPKKLTVTVQELISAHQSKTTRKNDHGVQVDEVITQDHVNSDEETKSLTQPPKEGPIIETMKQEQAKCDENNSVTDSGNERQVEEPIKDIKVSQSIKDTDYDKSIKYTKISKSIKETQVSEFIKDTKVTESIKNAKADEPVKEIQVSESLNESHVSEPVKEIQVGECLKEEQVNQSVTEMLAASDEILNTVPEPVKETLLQVDSETHNYSVKNEPMSEDDFDDMESSDDSCGTPENTMVIVERDIEAECHEWTREEDKVLLEIIKQYLASQERKNKSIFQILQEKGVYQLIAERLSEKSMDDIVQRVLYLLEVLMVNDK